MKSFFKVDLKNEEETHDWVRKQRDTLFDKSKNRVNLCNYNMQLYLGTDELDTSKHKISVPLLYNIIEANVNQMTRLNPKIRVLPTNDEYGDKGAAKVSKAVIDKVMDDQDYHAKAIDCVRQSYIFGDSFIQVDWDKTLGDVVSKGKDLMKMTKDVTKSMLPKNGDVGVNVLPPWRVLLQPKKKMEDVEYYTTYDLTPVDVLMEETGKTRDELLRDESFKIENEQGVVTTSMSVLNPDSMAKDHLEDHIPVYHFYHKRTKLVPNGAYIKFTDSHILSNEPYPFSMDRLNIAQLCDMKLPETLNGRSRIQLVSHLQRIYNLFTKLGVKYVVNTARTKYFAPMGSVVNPNSLGNNDAVSLYRGAIAPRLAQVPQLSGDLIGLKQDIATRMQQILGIHGISNGAIPKNLRATSSLQFLDRQEFERASIRVKSYGDLTMEVARLIVSVAGDNYKDDQKRLIRLVGRNKRSLLRHFKAADLKKGYDIKFEGTDGFPETTAAQRDRVLEIMQIAPQLVSSERWFQLLEMGGAEKLKDITGAALDSAESENEDLMNGNEVFAPESFEDHISHLEVHYPFIQSRDFKEFASNEIYDETLKHVQMHELFLLDIASTNPTVSAKLATIPLFPITEAARKISADIVKSQAQQQAVVQGQANRGEQVTEQIGVVKEGDENVGQ